MAAFAAALSDAQQLVGQREYGEPLAYALQVAHELLALAAQTLADAPASDGAHAVVGFFANELASLEALLAPVR
jgi:hypothetical protein